MKIKNRIGEKYGRLLVVGFSDKKIRGRVTFACLCDCGNSINVVSYSLKEGNTTSCGCFREELRVKRKTTHGKRKTNLYGVWANIKQRCRNKNASSFLWYGGVGIRLCEEWNDFEKFYSWAKSHGYKEGLSIDRIDSKLGYSPDNCQWITRSENSKKRIAEKGNPSSRDNRSPVHAK